MDRMLERIAAVLSLVAATAVLPAAAASWDPRPVPVTQLDPPAYLVVNGVDPGADGCFTFLDSAGLLSRACVFEAADRRYVYRAGETVTLVDPLPLPVRDATRIDRGMHPARMSHAVDARYPKYSMDEPDPDGGEGITTIGTVTWLSGDGTVFVLDTNYGDRTFVVHEDTDFHDLPREHLAEGAFLRVAGVETSPRLILSRDRTWPASPKAQLEPPRNEPARREPARRLEPIEMPHTGTPRGDVLLLGLLLLASAAAASCVRKLVS